MLIATIVKNDISGEENWEEAFVASLLITFGYYLHNIQ